MVILTNGSSQAVSGVLRQGGRCCACPKPVTKDTPWHNRHVVKLSHGATDAAANFKIYHLRCPTDVQFANVDNVQPGAQ